MKLPIGIHSGSSDVQTMWDQIRKWSERQIDGHNISDQLLGTGLEFSDEDTTIQVENRPARQIQVAIGDIVQAWDQQLDQLSTGSTLTQNVLPKANATSGLQDSAVSDDGTVVFASRSSIVIGVAQDTQITSSAAGVAKISDYTGGTAASLVFGAATTSRTRLDCSSTTLQTRLGDSSAYAVHAMKQVDLFGASTTKRVRFDPGTPTADSTVTVPKDVTGTMPVMTSVTANALHKSSGTDGTTVPSQITDDGTDATVGTSLVSTTKTTVGNLLVNKSNQTASSGGSYTVGATVGLVVVDMSALTAGQQFDVVLPSAVTYPGRTEIVKITVVGAATSVLKVSATAGNIEGAASKNWAGDVRCGAVLVSNGTDWYYAATVGVS